MNALRIFYASIVATALILAVSVGYVISQTSGSETSPAATEQGALSEDSTSATQQLVRDYLVSNPEVIEEALMALQNKRVQEARSQQSETITRMQDQLFNSKNQVVLGNPDGAVTLVEFFDYNCGYCRRAYPDMMALIDNNPDLKMVLKEFPILSEGSVQAARIAVAVDAVAPDSYSDFHREMMTRGGQADRAKALDVVRDLNLDVAAIEAKAGESSVDENLTEVQTMARALDISGTPSYIIADEAIPGAVGFDQLQQKVSAARKCGGNTLSC
ncbi:DsbA family protein [Afifella marina]|uniref:Protein-disulfide isomerase n=3 Tax=Hyphomicrobiales TaxID=356 RepID=A0A1G5MCC5_AFIMA|nr:DsbA family protein [Afifella marina]MBK1622637.1 hypothetical protein [Afifella marina DSM 2698]MBK1625632.1 hypothetical protein [Afifella marina]MBK5917455.1 hypothetical protein [Afifella marina]RAI23399.1 hypothetical protein CH311_00480 [Afifella marina DSM 2698]SCZ22816.1 Protein-disulfide isomerase [Afifella marina DSM 2698]